MNQIAASWIAYLNHNEGDKRRIVTDPGRVQKRESRDDGSCGYLNEDIYDAFAGHPAHSNRVDHLSIYVCRFEKSTEKRRRIKCVYVLYVDLYRREEHRKRKYDYCCIQTKTRIQFVHPCIRSFVRSFVRGIRLETIELHTDRIRE